ncbi:hypothetical protein [Cellulophaga baltica]|uniref:Uncharacterized protein n=1 Tax=Cellulophaga baltica TaxID=76594 RepID=A0A1G7I311_9FLAO|nr:hypothetical protein [Cellulophaga baltica]SDF07187.1 hypothetical protein SAMN04487992_10725 [Cellulophaga baltica]
MKKNVFSCSLLAALTLIAFSSCDNDDDNDSGINTIKSSQLYVSNNSDGNITVLDILSGEIKTLTTTSTAAEGIYYDAAIDEVIQASRSSNQLNVYSDISTFLASATISATVSSASDLQSPRDIAVYNDIVVVSDNSDVDGDTTTPDGRLFVYTKTNGTLTLRNIVITDFALWGIEFVNGDLYAVVDKTNELAVYTNFTTMNTTNAAVSASKRIAIEGIVRTHGLAYDNGTMILTDVGDAASDSDGVFHIISDFENKFDTVNNGDTMAVANNQVRVAGSNTLLGNPVAAEYDATTKTVFIAEAANGGGRVLSFSNSTIGGDLSPTINTSLAMASSLYFYAN